MRMLLINDSSVAVGGATKVFRNCISAALRQGFAVTAFVGDDGEQLRREFPAARIVALCETPLRDKRRPQDVIHKTFNVRALRALSWELRDGPVATVVHVHGWMQILSPSIFYVLRKSGLPVLVTAHDFFLACPNGAFTHFPSAEICKLKPLSASCLGSSCDKRSYLHKLWRYQRSLIQQAAGNDFWSDVTVLLAHEAMEDFFGNERFGGFVEMRSPVTPFVPKKVNAAANETITFLGRMTREKGVDTLIDALSSTRQRAQLLGAGPLLHEARKRLERAHCPGWVEDSAVSSLIERSRVFVMPSRMPEPYGLVAAEAMSSGLPVVVSRSCLISKEVEEGGAGLSFPAGDAEALAVILKRLEADDNLVAMMSENAYRLGHSFARTQPEWDRDLVALYQLKSQIVKDSGIEDGSAVTAAPGPSVLANGVRDMAEGELH